MASLRVMKFKAPGRLTDLVAWEVDQQFTREEFTFAEVAEDTVFPIGLPLAKDAEGNVIPLDPASETVTGKFFAFNIAEKRLPKDVGGQAGLGLADGPAVIKASGIVWPDGFDAAKQTAFLTELVLERSIKVR